jgi:hypothetical protein
MWRLFCSSRFIRLLSVLQMALAAGLLGVTASKADDAPRARPSDWSVGVTAGTLGLGGELSYLLSDYLVLRANGSYFEVGCGSAKALGAKCDYDLNVTALFAGATIDIHPLNNGWRLSAGGRYVDVEFAGSYTGAIELNGVEYSDIGTTKISIKNGNTFAPYLGFGFDSSHFSKEGSGFHLGIDLGAIYLGDPSVSIKTTKTVPGLDADIAKESATLKDGLKNYFSFYPVAMISARYSF